jgi:hypothetical protein
MIKYSLKTVCFIPAAVSAFSIPWITSQQHWEVASFDGIKVPVQLGVMSRCPDALLCENTFNHVLKKVAERVELSLIYVARYELFLFMNVNLNNRVPSIDADEPDFGVKCLHGPEECAGNVQQLCVAKHEPASKWWEFVQCQNYEGRAKIGNPDIAIKCAKASGFDWENSGAGKCAGIDGSGKGSEGIALLKESVDLTQKLHVK